MTCVTVRRNSDRNSSRSKPLITRRPRSNPLPAAKHSNSSGSTRRRRKHLRNVTRWSRNRCKRRNRKSRKQNERHHTLVEGRGSELVRKVCQGEQRKVALDSQGRQVEAEDSCATGGVR